MVLHCAVSTMKLARVKNLTRVSFVLLALAAAITTHAQGVKWHPGHYMNLSISGAQDARPQIDEIANVSSIKGVRLFVYWHEIEKSKGVYDFSKIDMYLNKVKSLPTPKRLIVSIRERRFGGTSKTGIVPNYILTDPLYKGGVAYQPPNDCVVARLWEPAVMDRLIALYRALGTRYNSNPYLEGFHTGETSIGFGSDKSKWPSGFSTEKVLQQYVRFARSARATMPQTNIFVFTNFIGGDANMGTLIQAMYESDVGAGGPSTIPNRLLTSQRVWTGVTGADYRGLIAIGTGIESFVFGGGHGDFTPKQVGDWAYKTLGVTHLFWIRNTYVSYSSPDQKWYTGILPYLRTNPPTRTACPTGYGSCNTK
jgi:hypothetical protein